MTAVSFICMYETCIDVYCISCVVFSMNQQTTMDESSVTSGPVITDEVYNQVISLLQLVRLSSGHWPEAAALFMDELSQVIHQGCIHPRVEVRWLHLVSVSSSYHLWLCSLVTPGV